MDVFAARRAALGITQRPLSPGEVEVARVIGLPVARAASLDWTRYELPGCKIELRDVQRAALAEIAAARGALLPIGVGHGKTLIALLSGMVLGCDEAIILVAPISLPEFERKLAEVRESFALNCDVKLLSWGELSQSDGEARLTALRTQKKCALIADEAHFARNATAARTQRLTRWLAANGDVPFVAMSGTVTTRRLKDFAHLARAALRGGSPVPVERSALEAWDLALAGDESPTANARLISPLWAFGTTEPFPSGQRAMAQPDNLARLRECFGERLRGTPGVLQTRDHSCSASIYFHLLTHAPDDSAHWRLAEQVARTYRDPDGLELFSGADVAAAAKRLSMGYTYRWQWDGDPDREWMDARRDWAKWCRRILSKYADTWFDTTALVEREARRHSEAGSDAEWVVAWRRWDDVRNRIGPRTVTEWLTDAAVDSMLRRAQSAQNPIVWYEEAAVADKLRAKGVRTVSPGESVPLDGALVALSIGSHGTTLNLQPWNTNILLDVPANGTTWEQLLGRTHRFGQQSDEIDVLIPQWSWILKRSLVRARKDATWITTATGNQQKLLLGSYIGG